MINNLSISSTSNETPKTKERKSFSVNLGHSVAGWHGYKKSPEKLVARDGYATSGKKTHKKVSLGRKKMYRKGVVDNSPMSSRAASQGLIPGYFKYAPRVSRNDATETGEVDEAEKE